MSTWGFRAWSRHSFVLAVAGFVYIGIGLIYIQELISPERSRALSVALRLMPIQNWGVLFIMAGVGALVSSKWPARSEKWGYAVLTGLSSAWGGFYAAGPIVGASSVSSLPAAFTWALIAFMWWAISGLSNPPRRDHGSG